MTMTTTIALDLQQELGNESPDPHRCRDLLNRLAEEIAGGRPMEEASGTSVMTKLAVCTKTVRLLRRNCTNDDSDNKRIWTELLDDCIPRVRKAQLTASAAAASTPNQPFDAANKSDDCDNNACISSSSCSLSHQLPKSTTEYLTRLKRHGKELYKNPPTLPPPHVQVYREIVSQDNHDNDGNDGKTPADLLPLRDANTQQLSFRAIDGKIIHGFHPNLTPEEIIRGGAFGGTYFRPIHSGVTNVSYTSTAVLQTTVDPNWMAGIDIERLLTSTIYRNEVNNYKVKCGGSLGMWESSGWISDADPYGWFQWYCRFYRGRRSSDDPRQIQRWMGVAGTKGRFKSQLCNKILRVQQQQQQRTNATDDATISPVIRQTLFHWGLHITEAILQEHRQTSKPR